jgi:GNAT superfamily N-acetyltransferase
MENVRPSFRMITVEELNDFYSEISAHLEEYRIAPINEERVRSLSHNPYADPGDIALLVAYIDGKCIGYLGFLPGRLMVEGVVTKVFWPSTVFVSSEYRGFGLAKLFFSRTFELPYDFILTGMVSGTEKIYIRMGIPQMGVLKWSVLERRRTVWMQISATIRRLEISLGLRISALLPEPNGSQVRHAVLTNPKRFRFPESGLDAGPYRLNTMSPERIPPVNTVADGTPFFYRGPEAIRWMIEYPWPGKEDDDSYFFSCHKNSFKHLLLGITSESTGDYVGYVLLKLVEHWGEKSVTVCDHELLGEDVPACLARIACACADYFGLETVNLPTVDISTIAILGRRWNMREGSRLYLGHPASTDSPLGKVLTSVRKTLHDGDQAFI